MSHRRITISITETVERTYMVSADELDELDLPTSAAELGAMDDDDLGVSLIESDLEDRYAVTDRRIDITDPEASASA